MQPSTAPATLVSIIVPTHNRSAMLLRALASALQQTHECFEILVIDDGSTDDTAQAVAAIGDSRIRYLRNQHAAGACAARNRGIDASHGAFVAFLDDDDEWLPRKLALQLACFAAAGPEVALVYGGSAVVSASTGRVVHTVIPARTHAHYSDYFGEITFTTSVVLIRRSALEADCYFDETLPGAQDRDLWIRLAKRFDFDFVPEVLVKRYIHGDQITASLPAKIAAKRQIIEKYRQDLIDHPQHFAHHLWRLGILECVAGDLARGRASLFAAIRRCPTQTPPWRDLFTAVTRSAASCREALTQRRLGRVDDIQLYY